MDSTNLTGKTFTRTRRRDGYEIDEVDGFLADVAQELDRRDKAMGELRGELTAQRLRPQEPGAPRPDGRHESSVAAARLLEIAAANADRLAAESEAEAESLVSGARAEADQLLSTARAEAERLSYELDRRKEQQTAELEQHRVRTMAEVADRKAGLEAQIAQLRQLESDHREHLRRHLSEQLAQLDRDTPPSLRAVAAD